MTAPTFPTLPSGALPDSSKFEFTLEDNTMAEELEGGYTATRARTTRRARRSYKVVYTFLPDADRVAIEDFWKSVTGGIIFIWTNPQSGAAEDVRFKGKPTFRYVGRLTEQRWDCDFEVQQA